METVITLKKTGYIIKGEALINLWGGGQGTIRMDTTRIDGKITKKKLLSAVNDGQFGCESIEAADLDVYALYEEGHERFVKTIWLNAKRCAEGMRGI